MCEKDIMNIERMIFAIDRINDYTKGLNSADELFKDQKTFDAVITQYIHIGECAYKISEQIKNNNQNIEWHKIIGMRNIIAHNYFGIDPRIIWKSTKKDLPELKTQLNIILNQ